MNFSLDAFRISDAGALFEADSDPEHKLRFEFPRDFVPSMEHAQRVIEQWIRDQASGVRYTFAFRASESELPLGGCELRPRSESIANVSYWARPAFRRRGVATCGVRLLRKHAFHAFAFHRLEALIDPDNEASRRVAQLAGFRESGVRDGRLLYFAERCP